MAVQGCSYVAIKSEINSDTDRCFCCMRNGVTFINFVKCKHAGMFGQIFHYKSNFPLKYICWECHHMLAKVVEFKFQVEKSIRCLNSMPLNVFEPTIVNIPRVHNLEQGKTEVYYAIDSKPFASANAEELTNHDTEIWLKDSTTNQNGGTVADHTNDNAVLPGDEDVDMSVDIKVEEQSDDENVPLSQMIVPDLLNLKPEITAKPSRSVKQKASQEEFVGKIRVVSLSKAGYLLEKQKEREKKAFLQLPFRCDDCVVGFDREITLQEHMEKRHGKKDGSFVCEMCRSVLTTEYSYKEHYRRHFKRYECCVCYNKRYNTFNAAVEHYRERHGAIASAFTCEQCGFTTDSNRRYRYHRDKHKVKPQCPVCGKSFANNSGLKVHVLSQHKESKEIYICSERGCNKAFSAKSGLRAHKVSVHRTSNAYCPTCNTHFKALATLRHHLMTHSAHVNRTDWKFTCDECGEKFFLKSALREHIDWKHLRKNTHQCQMCSKIFKNARALQKHKRFVHEKERPPKDKICDHCGKGFTTLTILRTHIRTHTGERPLSCSHCPATFAHPAALYTHNKLIHTKTA